MTRSILRFRLRCEILGNHPLQSLLTDPAVLNSTPWMGKEPGTCAIRRAQQTKPEPIIEAGEPAKFDPLALGSRPLTADLGGMVAHADFDIEVEYRSPDCILEEGGLRWECWRPRNGDGKLLRLHNVADFNEHDFGELVSEAPFAD